MPRCDFCNTKCGLLPFICQCCDKSFCVTHRMPECHNCSKIEELKKTKVVDLPKMEAAKRVMVKF